MATAQIAPPLESLKSNLSLIDIRARNEGVIGSEQFLSAIDALLGTFDLIQNDVLEGGRTDMAGNVEKIRAKFHLIPNPSYGLQDLIRAEQSTGQYEATGALVWLTRLCEADADNLFRGLEFFIATTKLVTTNGSEKLAVSITDSYKETLKKHHGFVAKTAIKLAISKTCPSREDLLSKLGQDQALVVSALKDCAASFERIMGVLQPCLGGKDIKF